jgi:predicted Zn-dependent protease
MKAVRIATALLIAWSLTTVANAQSKGNLRLTGKVVNEAGQPIEGADVRAAKKGEAEPQMFSAKTNKDGEWTIRDIAAGEWVIEAMKEGIGVAESTATLTNEDRNKIVNLTIKPKVDANAELQKAHQQAVQLAQAGKPAEARKIWEDLLAKNPTMHQFHGLIGTMYAAEDNPTKGLEHLRIVLEKDPANVDYQVLAAELMMDTGDKEGADKILNSVDITKVKDPRAFINSAINKINSGDKAQAEAAIVTLDKLIPQFPNEHMLLYLRGRANIVATKLVEAKADLEKYISVAPPTAPQVADAKKLIDQLTKK